MAAALIISPKLLQIWLFQQPISRDQKKAHQEGMAPSTTETISESTEQRYQNLKSKVQGLEIQDEHVRKPLQLRGVLEQFKYFDVTPIIGREFQDVNLAEWLRAPNSDELIRDLAITSE